MADTTVFGLTSDIHERTDYISAITEFVKDDGDIDAILTPGDHIGAGEGYSNQDNNLETKITNIIQESGLMEIETELGEINQKYMQENTKSYEELFSNFSEEDKKRFQDLAESYQNISSPTSKKIEKAIEETHDHLGGVYKELGDIVEIYGCMGNHDYKDTNQKLGIKNNGNVKDVNINSVYNSYEVPPVQNFMISHGLVEQKRLPPYELGRDVEKLEDIPEENKKNIMEVQQKMEQEAKDADILMMHKLPKDNFYEGPEYDNISPSIRVGGHIHDPESKYWKTKNKDGSYSYDIRCGTEEFVKIYMDDKKNLDHISIYQRNPQN